jgi:hypothetical protein
MDLNAFAPEERERIEHTLAALEGRGVQAIFVPEREDALAAVLDMIPRGSKVAHGTSMTLREIGLVDYLCGTGSGYEYLNPQWQAETDAPRRARLRGELSLDSDYFLGGVQAICETGQVIGTDATGSRQAFYIFGPPRVIWVAGINKIVPDVEAGLRRAREIALPKEDARMKSVGMAGSSIAKVVIYERERLGRISLVLVGEELGY